MKEFDYIIVGAGSAGCVLASRLTEDADVTVLLLEYGGSDNSIFIKMPTALSIPMGTERFNWGFESEPEPFADNRKLDVPRGKALGGSSSINGMVYVRGNAGDFDQWQSAGAEGWGYRHCLPYFKKAESWHQGADEFRGGDGPVGTCNGNDMKNPLYGAFVEAGVEAGYLKTEDYNGRQQDGFGAMHMTVDGGVRASTARAYLKPARSRSNLTVITHALTDRVVFEGKRAVGVSWSVDGTLDQARAKREVILSAGSVGSPAILQRSGVGPAAVLEAAGVGVLENSPGVGENLQDHLEIYFQFRCNEPITLNGHLSPFRKALIGARWLLFRSGLGATNHFESCAFIRSDAGKQWPDIQYHFLPAAIRYDGRSAFDGHGFQVHVGPNKPSSRGNIQIKSADPEDAPRILFNYLSHDDDIKDWRKCIRLTREILNQPAMDRFRGEEIQPGEFVNTDGAIDAWVRQNIESAYHPSCSCPMGNASGSTSAGYKPVLDNQCQVLGVENLRVVDSSVFPTIPNGNLNAPTIMVAEKMADMIRGREPLTASDAQPYVDKDWETRQRPGTPVRPGPGVL